MGSCCVCSSSLRFAVLLQRKRSFWCCFNRSSRSLRFSSRTISSSTSEDSRPTQRDFDPSEELLLGLDSNLQRRSGVVGSGNAKQRSWFGPNGQYIRELPCPICRGRGYTPCTGCDIERSRLDCSLCYGKGIMTCTRCSGDCVIWEESIDEQPWERARSISPLKVKEDDEVDNLEIKLGERKKSKRVYRSPPPEVGLKISISLRSLNAKTGLFSKHMKILHRDPKLHAQRVAAIKKTKGTIAARKQASETMKAFFSDPENRRKRSIAMKGVKFFCSNCGKHGHRRHYCPELIASNSINRRFRCRLCGQRGHNRRTCDKSSFFESKRKNAVQHQYRVCGQIGHDTRTCPQGSDGKLSNNSTRKAVTSECRAYSCSLCKNKGHNIRTCPSRTK
ncbi:hypothetical protein Syun_023753 [Stephania yunnanensis]|uniref:CCHC-type domain-containing protein n=1 Tax=Stephania yunnanensis TaxID=152371 RepID=A0AAP0I2G4_9MAGN